MAQFAVSDPENIQITSDSIEEETAVAGVVFRNLVGTHSQLGYTVVLMSLCRASTSNHQAH